jgi:anti-sigma B factor antagonist
MKITASTEDRVTVLELDGNLTIGAADEAFSAAVDRQIEAGRADIVLDMERVGLVDSTGLGSLVRSHHRCVQSGGGLRLANLDFHVWELIQTAQIAGVIPIFENLQAALKGAGED